MRRIRLIHWNESEAKERAERIQKAGYGVDYEMMEGPAFMKVISARPPDAVVIDLDRSPSRGRDLAVALRLRKTTRLVPIVFVEGNPEKVKAIQEKLPDAVYTTYKKLRNDLKAGLANPVDDPVVPESLMAAYAGAPLPKKLGIKENAAVALIGAPKGFIGSMGAIPGGVQFRTQARGSNDLYIWFIESKKELEEGIEKMIARLGSGKLWVAWPKRSSGIITDVTQKLVRETGLAAGLVDYKICSIDEIWSGLLFAKRRTG